MDIWKTLFPPKAGSRVGTQEEPLSSIHQRLQRELGELAEEDHVVIACLSGLLARVAFVDLEISPVEFESMVKALTEVTSYSAAVAEKIAHIAKEEAQELVDNEYHLYTRPLNKIFTVQQKENALRLLFQVAASDGRVENLESEEIRCIAKELRLSHEQFVQGKLTVREQIQALKGP